MKNIWIEMWWRCEIGSMCQWAKCITCCVWHVICDGKAMRQCISLFAIYFNVIFLCILWLNVMCLLCFTQRKMGNIMNFVLDVSGHTVKCGPWQIELVWYFMDSQYYVILCIWIISCIVLKDELFIYVTCVIWSLDQNWSDRIFFMAGHKWTIWVQLFVLFCFTHWKSLIHLILVI